MDCVFKSEVLFEGIVSQLVMERSIFVAQKVLMGISGIEIVVGALVDQIAAGSSTVKSVDFQAGLAHAEGDKVSATGSELPKKTWRLLHVDQGVVGEHVQIEPAGGVDGPTPMSSGSTVSMDAMSLTHPKPIHNVLRRDPPCGNIAALVNFFHHGFNYF